MSADLKISRNIPKTVAAGRASIYLERGTEYCVEMNAPADVVDELARRLEAGPELLETLRQVEEELDQRADAEGNGPGDYSPNWEMSLLQDVRAAIAKATPSPAAQEPPEVEGVFVRCASCGVTFEAKDVDAEDCGACPL